MDDGSTLRCSLCGRGAEPSAAVWRCACGGALDLPQRPGRFDAIPGPAHAHGVWRYRGLLPAVPDEHLVSLGEGATPLVDGRSGTGVRYKLEWLNPTGSFKDRGSTVLASRLRALGARRAIEDSSGNAGASVAAYCAAAGIRCDVYVPAAASPNKTRQIQRYGAHLVLVPGSRADVARAAQSAVQDAWYASHVWSPYFLAGTQTFAFEVWEQLGRRCPDNVVLPLGAGTLLLGAALGFRRLREAGAADRVPRLFGVQAANCAPLHYALRAGRESVDDVPFPRGDTMAEGIRIERPPRDRQVLSAIRESRGDIVVASEKEIYDHWMALGHRGLYVEPTGAVAAAAAERLLRDGALAGDETTIVALTGSGLKTGEAPKPPGTETGR